ncbi:pentatricopeptide repeat-containing protein At5g13770, chloroplastic [Malania oleifera]|uniref:pentatricopeptide repeat-containing protein At5g13770, chloroplastic n=1 Tax=Malania oleifera TaxID=397392 RepID=UPI0025AE9F14|nr:pentatricopeptide repeat-containing protein At5g13770, chloroplastic [Malania oleifera]
MAISSSLDLILPCCNTRRKNHNFLLVSTHNTVRFFALSFSNPPFPLANSRHCSSPIWANASANPLAIESALKLMDSQDFTIPNAHNLNGLLCRLFKDPQTEEFAYEYYRKAKEIPDFKPQKSTLNHLVRLISSCIGARKFKIVACILGALGSNGELAVSAFDSAMRGFNKLHMYRTTIDVYEQMKSLGIVLDSGCYSRIMQAYSKTSDYEEVVRLFKELEDRKLDPAPFSTKIHGIMLESLGKLGRAFEALELFREMIKKGVSENSLMYSSLICSFVSIRNAEKAKELLQEAVSKKMLRDPWLFLKLVLMYLEEGLVEKTLEVVGAMKSAKMKVSDCMFSSIVNGFSKKRGHGAAAKVYEELVSQGCEPGQVTYAVVINVYCRLGLYPRAETLFQEMEQKGFVKCVVAYSSMVAMYGKTGRLRDAMKLVAKMKERGCKPNVWIYNTLLDMHGRAKNVRQVEKLWKEMKRRSVVPDKVSYTTIINAYCRAGELETCTKYYQQFRLNGGVIDRAMGGIMVGVFSKTSQIEKLVKLLQDMKSEGTSLDGRLYQSALYAFKDAGMQMQARWLHENFGTVQDSDLTDRSRPKSEYLIR